MKAEKTFSDYINQVVGRPYQLGASGDAFDCWTLVQAAYQLLGLDLDFQVDYQKPHRNEAERFCDRPQWKRIDKPEPLCLAIYYSDVGDNHCGIWYKGRVLHAAQKRGVSFDRSAVLTKSFKHTEFYTHETLLLQES